MLSRCALLTAFLVVPVFAQNDTWKFPCPSNEIARYTSLRVSEPIRVDGKLDERIWQLAPTSPRFVDILSGQRTLYDTRAMVVWDDENLYLGYRIEEPRVRASRRSGSAA